MYDDHVLIEQRGAVHSLARLPELWEGEFWEGLASVHFRYLRPLVSTSYALDWAIHGGAPAGFHATNLALHALVTFLLFGALARWSKAREAAGWGALVAALAWAWHPSKVEVVSWIAGRTDLLAAVGILVTCLGVRKRLAGSPRAGALLECLGLFVAFTSKEIAVVVPAFVFVEAWSFFEWPRLDRAAFLRVAKIALPHAALCVVYFAARAMLMPIIPAGAGHVSFFDARLYTFETLGEFARILLVPFPLSIQRAPIRFGADMRVLHDPTRLAVGVAAAVVLAACVFAWRKSATSAWRIVGIALGVAALVPVSNVVSARMVFLFAERFAYVPLMGFALSVVPTESAKPAGSRGRLTPLWTAAPWAIILVASALLSVAHTRHFLDDESLWKHELAVNPRDPLALRFASEDATRHRDDRAALDLAIRGFEASAGWPVTRSDRVEFAARAARSLELVTLDSDRPTLAGIVAFYRTFLEGHGTAHLDGLRIPLRIEAAGLEATNFRNGDESRMATMELWAAIAASRIEACDFALSMVHAHLARAPSKESAAEPDQISAALVLARCSAWDDALDIAARLEKAHPEATDLGKNIAWARAVAGEDHASLDGALRSSRAHTLLLDRGGAFAALAPFRGSILGDAEASTFYARVAWAAGEDDDARRALAPHMNEHDATTLLASWSRELRRN